LYNSNTFSELAAPAKLANTYVFPNGGMSNESKKNWYFTVDFINDWRRFVL